MALNFLLLLPNFLYFTTLFSQVAYFVPVEHNIQTGYNVIQPVSLCPKLYSNLLGILVEIFK